jgi:hypothetical protein
MKSVDFPDFWIPDGQRYVRRLNPDPEEAYAFQVYNPENGRWMSRPDPGARPWREAQNPEVEPRLMEPVEFMQWLYRHQRVLVSTNSSCRLRYDEDAGYQFGYSGRNEWGPARTALWHARRLLPEDGEPWGDE